MAVPDLELLEAWRAGDNAAADALVRRHFPLLRRFFRNKVPDGIDDLIQQTFLQCVERRDRFPDHWSFRTCLLVAARDQLYARYREQPLPLVDASVQSLHDLGTSPSSFAARRSENRLLFEGLRRIPIDMQVALELYYWEELRAPQLSRVLGVPEGTVRSRLRRGKALLREKMLELAEPSDARMRNDEAIETWARSIAAEELDREPADP